MKSVIYVFSGTGNTKKVAELYRKEFEIRNISCDIVDIDCNAVALPDTAEYDYVGLAYPIHAFNAPYIVEKFVKTFPKQQKGGKKNIFIFKTGGEPMKLNNASNRIVKRFLRRRNYKIFSEYHYCMPYNIMFRHSDKMVHKMWSTAQSIVPIDVDEITTNKQHKLPNVFGGHLISWVLSIEQWAMKLNGKNFKVTDDCIDCGMCVRECPANNIYKDENGKIKFKGKCVMCSKCSFGCPKNAIKTAVLNNWKVNGAYSFNPPDAEEITSTKHDNYCKKAYTRYFSQAQKRIELYEKNNFGIDKDNSSDI